jgi:hypothetical protein
MRAKSIMAGDDVTHHMITANPNGTSREKRGTDVARRPVVRDPSRVMHREEHVAGVLRSDFPQGLGLQRAPY